MAPPTSPSAHTVIPFLYRLLLLYFEPIFALSGSVLVLTNPAKYVGTMSRHSIRVVDPATTFIYTELAGGWLHFAFVEAVLFRFVDDVRVWRLACLGMLLSDLAYCHSCAEAVGGWGPWLVLSDWTVDDWVVTVTTWPFVLARVAILFEIGFPKGSGTKLFKRS